MNYLGHIYLSGQNDELLVGNFIGDYVKGKAYLSYPKKIMEGILLHRKIDDFTDSNEHWRLIKSSLQPIYSKYAGVVADIVIDHFLAKNWMYFSDMDLNWSAKWAYAALLKQHKLLPMQVQDFLPYLIQHKRLQSYAQLKGIEISLNIMSKRTSLPNHTKQALNHIVGNNQFLEKESTLFIHSVSKFVGVNK